MNDVSMTLDCRRFLQMAGAGALGTLAVTGASSLGPAQAGLFGPAPAQAAQPATVVGGSYHIGDAYLTAVGKKSPSAQRAFAAMKEALSGACSGSVTVGRDDKSKTKVVVITVTPPTAALMKSLPAAVNAEQAWTDTHLTSTLVAHPADFYDDNITSCSWYKDVGKDPRSVAEWSSSSYIWTQDVGKTFELRWVHRVTGDARKLGYEEAFVIEAEGGPARSFYVPKGYGIRFVRSGKNQADENGESIWSNGEWVVNPMLLAG
jgi:hypothetical protein